MENKNYYIITDTHFFHKKVVEYCFRPEDFQEKIIKGLNQLGENDILIHLGDICVGRDKETSDIIKNIKCYKKILVRGNHDSKSSWYYMENGWDYVCDGLSLNYGNKRIYFSHKPILKNLNFDINIHGHFHNAPEERWDKDCLFGYDKKFHKLLVLEDNNYKPFLLGQLIS